MLHPSSPTVSTQEKHTQVAYLPHGNSVKTVMTNQKLLINHQIMTIIQPWSMPIISPYRVIFLLYSKSNGYDFICY